MRSTNKISFLGVLLPLVLGLPFLVIGGVELAKMAQRVSASERVVGTVVDNLRETFGEGTAYVPVVEFVTVGEGEVVRFTDGIGSEPAQFEVGEQVEVVYDPATPRDARVATWMRLWFAPTLLVVAEWDRDTPPSMATAIFPLLTNSPGKRLVMLAEGTHTILMERNRGALYQTVQGFLEEAAAA